MLIYDQLDPKNKFDRNIAKKSWKWFENKVFELWTLRDEKGKFLSKKQIIDNSGRANKTIVVGNMYIYAYDPKWKEELPYYDKFPLILPFSKFSKNENQYFIGINLHYLHPAFRAKLLNALVNVQGDPTLTEQKKLNISWQLIKSVSKNIKIQNTVKEYLLSHVRSPFMKIPTSEWWTAIMLPTESFVKKEKRGVWSDSMLTKY